MELLKRLDEDLKSAMRAKDTVALETVRNVRGAIRRVRSTAARRLTKRRW